MAAYQFRFDVLDNLTRVVHGFGASFTQAQRQAQSFADTTNRLSNIGAGAGMGLMKLNSAVSLLQTGMTTLQQPFKDAMEIQSVGRAINFASGGALEGAKNIDFLRTTIDKMGLPLKESMQGFKTLDASMYGTGLSQVFVRDMFQNTAMATTVLGVSADKTQNAFIALGQMASKGVVSMQELREQLGDALPGAASIAARAMNMKMPDFNKLVESGKLLSGDFLPKFSVELKKTFEGDLPGAINGATANFNRFNNSFTDMGIGFAESLLPAITSVMPVITGVFKGVGAFFRDNKSTIGAFMDEMKRGFSAVYRFMQPLFVALAPVVIGIFNVLGNAFNRLKGFLIANEGSFIKIRDTIGWLAQKIGFVLIPLFDAFVGMYFAYHQVLLNLVVGIIDGFTKVGNAATSIFNWIGEKVSWFGNLFMTTIEGIFPGFTEAFQKTKDWLYNKFIKPIADWFGALFKFDVGITNTTQAIVDTSTGKKTGTDAANEAAKGTNKGAVQSKLDSVKGDGSKMTNVYINIEKLNDGGIQVITQNYKESEGQLKEFFTRLLLDATNQLNYTN